MVLTARLSGLLVLLLGGLAFAQAPAVTLGLGGELVQGRWNPLHIEFRDQRNVSFELRIDQGSLRAGPSLIEWRIDLPGGAGLHVHQDDIFIPEWQSLSWTLSTEARVLASGTLNPRDRDDRPTVQVLSSAPARYAGLFGDDVRLTALAGSALPERAAAWDGVAALLIDGTTAPPRLESVAAAAAAGVGVMLLTPLPASYADLILLAPEGVTRYGAGAIMHGTATELSRLHGESGTWFDPSAIDAALAGLNSIDTGPGLAPAVIFSGVLLFSLLSLLLLRVAGIAGGAAALGLGLLGAAAAWPALGSGSPQELARLELAVSASGLTREFATAKLFDRSGVTYALDGAWRTLGPVPFRRSAGSTELRSARWQVTDLARRPMVGSSTGAALPTEDPAYDSLMALFPSGSLLSVSGSRIEVHLP